MRNRADLQKVALEDPDFERRYAVFSSDPAEGRYILTPLLMERILSLEAQAGHSVHLSFLGDHVHLAVHYGRALFEPTLVTSVSYEAVVEIARHFGLAEVIVSELDLNVRIWSKGVQPEARDAVVPRPSDQATPGHAPGSGVMTAASSPPRPTAVRQSATAPRPAKTARAERAPLALSRAEILAQLPKLPGLSGVSEGLFWLKPSTWIAVGVALATYSVFGAMMRPMLTHRDQGILVSIAGSVVAFVAWIGYGVYADGREGRQKLVVYAAGLLFFFLCFLAPRL